MAVGIRAGSYNAMLRGAATDRTEEPRTLIPRPSGAVCYG